jgi:hypothetical protein
MMKYIKMNAYEDQVNESKEKIIKSNFGMSNNTRGSLNGTEFMQGSGK